MLAADDAWAGGGGEATAAGGVGGEGVGGAWGGAWGGTDTACVAAATGGVDWA